MINDKSNELELIGMLKLHRLKCILFPSNLYIGIGANDSLINSGEDLFIF